MAFAQRIGTSAGPLGLLALESLRLFDVYPDLVTRKFDASFRQALGGRIVILLGGGTKKRQQRDIEAAIANWRDYKRRK